MVQKDELFTAVIKVFYKCYSKFTIRKHIVRDILRDITYICKTETFFNGFFNYVFKNNNYD